MRLFKTTSVVCALALVFASLPLVTAAGLTAEYVITDTGATVAATNPPANQPQANAAADASQTQQTAGAPTKKRSNLFVRVITAPFRGLARLFGGKQDSTQTARRKTVKPKPQTAATAATPAPANTSLTAQTSAVAATVTTAAPQVEPSARQQPQPQQSQPQQAQPVKVSVSGEAAASLHTGEATRTDALPSAAAAPPARMRETAVSAAAATSMTPVEPRPFTPNIEGVGGDPLSQGRALLNDGHLNEAIAELSVAAVAGPDLVEANNLLGLAYDRRGDHKGAQEFYDRALSVAPQNARVLNNLGHSLYLDDRYKDALARLKVAARLAPADTEVANNLALVYGRLGKYDDAFKAFKRAGGEFYASMQTAELLMTGGRDRDAIKYYEAARELNPASSDVLRQLITLYVRTGQREKAEAAGRALDLTPAKKGASASS